MANPKKKPAYSRPRAPKPPKQPEQQYPGVRNTGDSLLGTIWDTMKAPLEGIWSGLAPRALGGGKTYDQFIRERARKRRGYQVPRYAKNWLERTIDG